MFLIMNWFCITIALVLNFIEHSKQDRVVIPTNSQNWIVSEKHKYCKQPLIFKNRIWNSELCKPNKSSSIDNVLCELKTEVYRMHKIRELTVDFQFNITKNSETLHILSIRQISENDSFTRLLGNGIDPTIANGKEYEIKRRTFKVQMINFIGISFDFSNTEGFCGSINYINLTYYTCNKLKNDLVSFPEETAPAKGTMLKLKGQCHRHSIASTEENIYRTCNWKGEVKEFGTCVCYPGFTKYEKRCISCTTDSYKRKIGNQPCSICGDNSISTSNYQSCICKNGFFRELKSANNNSAPCYDIRARNLSFSSIATDSVYISWQSVDLKLTVRNITFIVDCDNCLQNEGFFPRKSLNNGVYIKNLQANKVYSIAVTVTFSNMNRNGEQITIRGSFRTAGDLHVHKQQTILIATITGTLILLCTALVIYLYIVHKRKTTTFLKRINSLKKHRRPPPPPQPETIEEEISPYAVFIRPQIQQLDTDEESEDEANRTKETKKIFSDNESDGYVSMTYNVKNKFLDQARRILNEYAPPMSNNNRQNIPQVKINSESDLRKSRTQSCYFRDSTGYELSILQIEKAKLTNKYKSRDYLDCSIPRRPHSADDVNKLHDIEVT